MSAEWEDDETTATVETPPSLTPPKTPAEDDLPKPGSVLDELGGLVDEAREAVEPKVLRVGKNRRLRASYRPLEDEETDALRQTAKVRQKTIKATTRTGKGGKQAGTGEEEYERYVYALIIATSCIEILYEDDDGEYHSLQDIAGTPGPVRYDRDLARFCKLDELFGLDLNKCTPVEIVTALHTWAGGSTSPVNSTGRVLELWGSAIDAEALEEALGGN